MEEDDFDEAEEYDDDDDMQTVQDLLNCTYSENDADQTFEIDEEEEALMSDDSQMSSAYQSLSDTGVSDTIPQIDAAAVVKKPKRRKRKSKKSNKAEVMPTTVAADDGQDSTAKEVFRTVSSGVESISGSITTAGNSELESFTTTHHSADDENESGNKCMHKLV